MFRPELNARKILNPDVPDVIPAHFFFKMRAHIQSGFKRKEKIPSNKREISKRKLIHFVMTSLAKSSFNQKFPNGFVLFDL
jgi:hypothetical protein